MGLRDMGVGCRAGRTLLLAQLWLSPFNHFQDMRPFNVSHPHPSAFPGLRLLRLEFLSSFIEKLFRMEKNRSTCPVRAVCPAAAGGKGRMNEEQNSRKLLTRHYFPRAVISLFPRLLHLSLSQRNFQEKIRGVKEGFCPNYPIGSRLKTY